MSDWALAVGIQWSSGRTLASFPHSLGADLAQADILDFTLLLQLTQRSNAFREGTIRVPSVQVIQIRSGADTFSTVFEVLSDMGGRIVNSPFDLVFKVDL
jgi:hypothetical protein